MAMPVEFRVLPSIDQRDLHHIPRGHGYGARVLLDVREFLTDTLELEYVITVYGIYVNAVLCLDHPRMIRGS